MRSEISRHRMMKGEGMPEQSILEVAGLKVRYGRTAVFDGVSFTVAAGQVCALLGRNGTGKSSLVRCLLGQQKPDAGEVQVLGRDVWRHRALLMEHIGVAPEEPDAPPLMTVRQLDRFGAQLYARWDGEGLRQRLARFEVPLEVPFVRLSRGQKAQVMLSLALAPEPQLLILDDPTLGLDAVARRAVFEELVVELADRGITVFLCSHDLAGIEAIASQVMVLGGGRLLLDEDLEELKQRFRRLSFQRIAGVGDRQSDGEDLLAELEPLVVKTRGRGVEAVVSRFDDGVFERFCQHRDVEGVELEPLPLEEIVVALVGEGATGGLPIPMSTGPRL